MVCLTAANQTQHKFPWRLRPQEKFKGKDNLMFEVPCIMIQDVQLKSGPYFNMSNLFIKIYNMLYYTTNLYLQ
jgi:hypothetical protein